MIANRVELMMRRRQTAAFIRADPTSIQLHRREKVEVNGGWKWGPETTLGPQEVRIVPAVAPQRDNVRMLAQEEPAG